MSNRNSPAQKHLIHLICPALAAFPGTGAADTKAGGTAMKYRILKPGPHVFTFENVGAKAVTLSVETSPDDATYSVTTSALNNTAVTQEVIQPKVSRSYDVNLPSPEGYVRIRAIGGTDVEMTITPDNTLERMFPAL